MFVFHLTLKIHKMGTVSQLEIYKILSGKKTFRELILGRGYYQGNENLNDSQILMRLFGVMIRELTADTVWIRENETKGLTLFANNGEEVNTILSCHSEHSLIEGFIDGGPFNRVGNITPKDDKLRVKQIGKNEIVTQRYYIYLSMPLDSNIALLFIEKKGESSISKIANLFLCDLLKNTRIPLKSERYIPQSIIQDYRNNGKVDSFVYSVNITSDVLDGEGVETHEEKYDVELKITPQNGNVLHFDTMGNIMNSIGRMAIKFGDNVVNLSESHNTKAIVSKGSRLFKMDVEDFKVKPLIYLDDAMQEENGRCLKREEIKSYCGNLERDIHEEVYNVRAHENE